MKPGLARGILVAAVFALLAAVTIAGHYFSEQGLAPPPSKVKGLDVVFWSSFRYYLAWLLCAPAVLWLGRRVPIVRRRWGRAVTFHLMMPVAVALPFFTFRLLLNAALTFSSPPLHVVSLFWWRIITMESVSIAPIYWLLIAIGQVIQIRRDDRAGQLRRIELQRSLDAAQLDSLRMRLQPHFLFNTLNAMGALARQGDTDDVVQMVDHVGTLLRLSMETSGRQFVTLDDELRLLDAYLAIEEVRYRDRLVVERRIAPEAGGSLVPSLILQPLVQNAITHALAQRIDPTTLEISARRDATHLDVTVRDNGPGLPSGWTLASSAGRGLRTVAARLRALYGEAARLDVGGAPGGGTIVGLRLPLDAGAAPTGRS